MKVNVYVDAFNLYYALKSTPYKWLDLGSLAQKLVPRHQINRIRYFTAPLKPRPNDQQIAQRQRIYIRALETVPNLTVHYGRFLVTKPMMMLAQAPPSGSAFVRVIKTEEKGSDVNLATYLLLYAFDGDFEMALVVSNDSDLVEPIEMVASRFGLLVGIINPLPRTSLALAKVASFHRKIRTGVLASSQFPSTLTDAHGTIAKPPGW